jgi:eukaryotic-like serine/threonine-protein kinase
MMDPKTEQMAASLFKVTAVVQILGGGQKFVAKCVTESGGPAILKIVEIDASNGDALERARREVSLLGRIDHPNVVKVIAPLEELGSPPTAVAWLEEELDGVDLRPALSAGVQWSWHDACSLGLDVGSGLSALHAEKVVHRDLSPANVMQRADGTYTVIDPGFGRHLENSTLTGIFQPGTLGFMTPEHIAARVIYASDVFALGTLMYLALTAQLPIPVNGSLDAYRVALRDDQSPSVGLLRPDLSTAAIEVVDRCLQRQSGRRYRDASELVAALEAL